MVQISQFFAFIKEKGIQTSDIINQLLQEDTNMYENNIKQLLGVLSADSVARHVLLLWAHNFVKAKYMEEIRAMILVAAGWHFSVKNAEPDQFENFDLEEMAQKMAARSPFLWDLLGDLLTADKQMERRRLQHLIKKQRKKSNEKDSQEGLEEEDKYWIEDEDVAELDDSSTTKASSNPVLRRKIVIRVVRSSL